MRKKRYEHIDFLRAVAIIGVIAIHTVSYNLTNSTTYQIWNYLNFVVVSFVFCSGYVLTAIYSKRFTSVSTVFHWYKKRLLHLIIPFYIYLASHYLLWILFPSVFSGLGLQKSSLFLIQSITFTGGIDLNWLTLLFIQLTLLFPVLVFMTHHKKWVYLYTLVTIAATAHITIFRFPYAHYRAIMWLPWSMGLLVSMYFFSQEQHDSTARKSVVRYIKIGFLAGVIFFGLLITHLLFHKSFQLVDYKYPPDFYYISYGFLISCIILILGEEFKIHHSNQVRAISRSISTHSYFLFFIHFIMLDVVLKNTKNHLIWAHPMIQFIMVLTGSFVVCYLVVKLQHYVFKKNK